MISCEYIREKWQARQDRISLGSRPSPVSMNTPEGGREKVEEWSFEENKMFENAIAEVGMDCPVSMLVQQIASRVPGKSLDQVGEHLQALLIDVEMIESGAIPLPDYDKADHPHRRRKGVAWTPEEHRLFLEGLEKYGKGDWRSISRFCVKTRSPSQVASHAQKYFLRLLRDSSSASQQGPAPNPGNVSGPEPHCP